MLATLAVLALIVFLIPFLASTVLGLALVWIAAAGRWGNKAEQPTDDAGPMAVSNVDFPHRMSV